MFTFGSLVQEHVVRRFVTCYSLKLSHFPRRGKTIGLETFRYDIRDPLPRNPELEFVDKFHLSVSVKAGAVYR